MNPMIRKELRQRMRERRGWLLPTLYLLLLGGVVLLAYETAGTEAAHWAAGREVQGAEIGIAIFVTVAYTQLSVLLLLAPALGAGAIAIEKEQRTLAALLTSLLTPGEIWWGKFVAALSFQALLLLTALPVLALAFAFGGVSPWDVAVASGTTLVILASVTAVGLYCSSYFRRSAHATAVSYAIVIGLVVLTTVVAGLGPSSPFGAALTLNPFYTVTLALAGAAFVEALPGPRHVLVSLLVFVALAALSAALAVRNLARSGDQA